MNKRKFVVKKTVVIVSLILAVGLLAWWLLSRLVRHPTFSRLQPEGIVADTAHFRTDPEISRTYFIKDGKEIRLENIASNNGTCLFLRGRRIVHIRPSFTGRCGLYSYISWDSLNKPAKIKFTLRRQNKDHGEDLHVIETDHLAHPLIHQIDVAANDRILFVFEGYGTVYFSKPVQYRQLPAARQKLVILIGVDTLRADRIGRQVGGRSLTPNIDRFSGDAVRFSHAVSQSSWTIPAFVSLFTGQYEFDHGVSIKSRLTADKPQLVHNLAGRFICFGIHGGLGLDSFWGYSRGFDYYMELPQAGPLYPRGGESLFQKAMEFVERACFPDLFLFLHTYQVHAPYTPPPEYLEQIDPRPPYPSLDVENSNKPERTFVPVEPQKRRALEELYDAEVLAFDDFFGRFVSDLRHLGLYDNAMIVFLSDHGEEFFEHGGWGHSHSLYDELVRIPLIIKFPGGKFAGKTIAEPAGLFDVLPTILDYYGIDYPREKIDGSSLLPQVTGKHRRDQLLTSIFSSRYIEAIPPKIAIFNWPWKLIVNYPYTPESLDFFKCCVKPPAVPEYELFDLATDPGETKNLAVNPQILSHWLAQAIQLKKRMKENESMRQGNKQSRDPEVMQKLKSLGYI